LKGFADDVFAVGVDGRAISPFAISSSKSLRSSVSASSASTAGGQFSLFCASITCSFGEWKVVAIVTTFVVISPKTFGDPSFLGDGKSSLRVEPKSSSTSMGLCCVPAHLAGLDLIALLKAAEAASDVIALMRFIGRILPLGWPSFCG
jgi:hypothetical protein